jgi:hypothetical protein
MSDPSTAIHDAFIASIKALATKAGDRVFGQIRLEKTVYPYVTVWPGTLVTIDEECWDRSETSMQVDVWGDTESYFAVKEIAGAIRMAFHEQDMAVDGHVVDRLRVDGITYSNPSPASYRAMLTITIETQPAA